MKNETARREIESLDYYLQSYTDDYSEESHTAMMMAKDALSNADIFDKIKVEIEQLPITDTAVRLVTAVVDKYKVGSEK